jgi:hypothetical protein
MRLCEGAAARLRVSLKSVESFFRRASSLEITAKSQV